MQSWRDAVPNHRFVSRYVLDEMDAVVRRALAAGAEPPLEYQGAGEYGVVLCDALGHAWKVARHPELQMLEIEAEWLDTAATIPTVRDHVAKYIAYHPDLDVIERECVIGETGTPRDDARLLDLHNWIGKQTWPHGWKMPEFKENGYVIQPNGRPVLIDASNPVRVGRRQLEYVKDILAGRRPRAVGDSDSTLAWTLRMDVLNKTLAAHEAEPVLRALGDPES